MNLNTKRPIGIDFDGVLHDYRQGWKGPRTIEEQPVGWTSINNRYNAIAWLVNVVQQFDVNIHSRRSHMLFGRFAMKRWLRKWLRQYYWDLWASDPDHLFHLEDVFDLDHGLPLTTAQHDFARAVMRRIKWPKHKPLVAFAIDDRVENFRGEFPTMEHMQNFQPWNRVGSK